MNTTKFLWLLTALIVASPPAAAQYSDSMGYGGWNNPMSSMMSTILWNRLIYRTPQEYKNGTMSSGTSTGANSPKLSAGAARATAVDDKSVKFRATGDHIRTPALAAKLGSTTAEREEYLKLMNAVIDAFGQHAQKAGLQNDLALALAYFLGENVRVYRGLPELTDVQYLEIRNTITETLASTGALTAATDLQKQEFYEALVAYTGITQYGYEQGLQANNDAVIKGYQKIAGRNLQTVTGISPDDMDFGARQTPSSPTVSGGTVDINQFRGDYSENATRADQLYKGKRFVFTGSVTDVSGNYYKTIGTDPVGRPIVSDLGSNVRLSSVGGPTVIGFEVHCFFKDNNQLTQVRGRQRIAIEATVHGREDGNLILVDGVLR